MVRNSRLIVGALAAAALLVAGGTAVAVLRPASAQASAVGERPVLQLHYEVRREPAYVAPPPTEEARLEVLSAQAPTAVEEGVMSAQAGAAVRALQNDDAARAAAALAAVRAEDARIDRETTSAMHDDQIPREADPAPSAAQA